MRNNDRTRILGWPGYRVYRNEINEQAKTLKLWVRRKAGQLVCSGCGRSASEIAEVYEREVRDLPCFEYRTTVVVVELLRALSRLRGESREDDAVAEQSPVQPAIRGCRRGVLRERGSAPRGHSMDATTNPTCCC